MARHGSIADQLQALLVVRDAPEGPIEALQTNWSVTPDHNNAASEEVEAFAEQRLRMRPSIGEIMREWDRANSDEYPEVTIERNDKGQIISIGRLKFSDGKNTEKHYKRVLDGQVVQYDRVMPVGAMLGMTEETERALGGEGFLPSNKLYTEVYGGKHPNKTRRKKRKDNPRISKDDERRILSEAYANTPVLPPVKKCPAGFPSKPSNLRELFVGYERSATGECTPLAWQDITVSMVNRETWTKISDELSDGDKKALSSAMTAGSFTDVGMAVGQSRMYSWKKGGGKRRLLAANDNFMAAVDKISKAG